mgnify:CR=1 FL=1
MGSRKISSLPVASIDGTEELLVNDSGTSKKVTIQNAVNSVVDVSGATVGGDLSGTVSNAQLTANSVGTSEIVDGSVTAAKLDTTYESADANIQTHITASHSRILRFCVPDFTQREDKEDISNSIESFQKVFTIILQCK